MNKFYFIFSFAFILTNIFNTVAVDNKSLGEFCEKRLQNAKLVGWLKFEEHFKRINESGELKQEYESIPEGKLFPSDEGAKDENRVKNRYLDKYLAYDHSRVKLNKRYGDIEVVLDKCDFLDHYIVRNYLLRYQNKNKLVTHYHFMSWPDEGVPEHPSIMFNFVKAVRANRDYRPAKPLVVHCAGGMGRTGTFILIDSMLQAVQKFRKVDFAQQLCSMRSRRINLVETYPQYVFAHEVLSLAINEIKKAPRVHI
ncbi:receptor-type tyrosine-protein phosphatase kappa-like protein [Dinothrombium tinctorium]|uniref:protein-tyrosine-phosphatase n=1 Tax=Dinothrombium tinctorium TaxID=1965070 RepID=A0A443RIN4_9ACAR|nr:receptor-type tyrosine-protein phosphatase kappa-like protein [Dinothrombium tinctorium]